MSVKPKSMPDDSVMGQAYDARLMKRLLKYLKGYYRFVFLAVLLLLLATGVELAGPLLIKAGIDKHIAVGKLEGLNKIALMYIGLLVSAFFIRYTETYLTQWIGQKVVLDIRTKLFDHLQKMDIKFIDSRPVGWLMTRVTGDIQTLNEMFTSGVVAVFGDIFMLLGIIIVMLVINWKLALVTFTVLPILIWVVISFRRNVRLTFREIREALAQLNGFIQEHITGVRTVQLFGRDKHALNGFQERNIHYRSVYIRAIYYYAIFFPAVSFLSALATALILLVGGLMIHNSLLTWGALVAFLSYSERFFRPIRDLSERYNTMQAAMAAAERVFWLMDSEANITDPDNKIETTNFEGRIAFENVNFRYNEEEPILQDVSFSVEPGQTVAVVGATGAGKTTLISLLQRFWDVDDGRITLDGRDIREYNVHDLRRTFGVVLQDVFLFSGSVHDNVALGALEKDDPKLKKALDEANALEFVEALPEGLEQGVGERGARLSGGQKQLLAIARALAKEPRILLLDEATAAVDSETEQRIQDALDRLMHKRTTLVVAHRLSTIQNADKIVVMHKGRVRETGTHKELIAMDGLYAKLYRLQFAESAAA